MTATVATCDLGSTGWVTLDSYTQSHKQYIRQLHTVTYIMQPHAARSQYVKHCHLTSQIIVNNTESNILLTQIHRAEQTSSFMSVIQGFRTHGHYNIYKIVDVYVEFFVPTQLYND